jgi:thiosulfate dehydrogenase [quinone] large subunit
VIAAGYDRRNAAAVPGSRSTSATGPDTAAGRKSRQTPLRSLTRVGVLIESLCGKLFNDVEDMIELFDLIRTVGRHRVVALATLAVVLAATAGYVAAQTRVYQSTVTVQLSSPDPSFLSQVNSVTPLYAALLTADQTLGIARGAVHDTPLADIAVRSFPDSPVLKVDARGSSADGVQRSAAAVVSALTDRLSIGAALGVPRVSVAVVDGPSQADTVWPRPALSLAVAGVIGIFLGVAMAWLADVPRRRRAALAPAKGPGRPGTGAHRVAKTAASSRVDRRGRAQGGHSQPVQAIPAGSPGQAFGITTGQPAATNAQLTPWRPTGFGVLRIVFGVAWGIDAWFKWQPEAVNNFANYLAGPGAGQSGVVHGSINFWINVVRIDPRVFAHAVAAGETLVAAALLLGAFSNLTNVLGILVAVVSWPTAAAFGGPYQAAAGLGAAIVYAPVIVYALVFVALFLSSAGLYLGLDRRLTPRLGRFGFLASGGWPPRKPRGVAPVPAVSVANDDSTVAEADAPRGPRFFVTKRFTKR